MQTPRLAIIIPCYNEELCVETTCNKLVSVMNDLSNRNVISNDSYIYLVDDGSTDKTWEIIETLHQQNSQKIKGTKFIRNYGNQKALIAGIEGVGKLGCDCAISIDADLQQDENSIEKFVNKYKEGYDIVLGVRKDRKTDSMFKKHTAILFYKTMNLLGAKIEMNHSDYRLISERAIKIMNQYQERALFLRGFFHEVGLKMTTVKFDVKPRFAGKSKFNWISLMGLALNGITSFSIVPLRLIADIGFLMACIAFLIGVIMLFQKIFYSNNVNDFATFIIITSFFSGIQLFSIGIIGEYLGQVYNEVKNRPRYITEKELA